VHGEARSPLFSHDFPKKLGTTETIRRIFGLSWRHSGGCWSVGRQIEALPQKGEVDRGSADALESVEVMLQVTQDGRNTLPPGTRLTNLVGRPVI
jgi:hypothetical protein